MCDDLDGPDPSLGSDPHIGPPVRTPEL